MLRLLQVTNCVIDYLPGLDDPCSQRCPFGRRASFHQLLITLSAALRRVRLGLLSTCEPADQRRFLLGVSRGLRPPAGSVFAGGLGFLVSTVCLAELAPGRRLTLGLGGGLPRLGRVRALLRLLGPVVAGLLLRIDPAFALSFELASILAGAHGIHLDSGYRPRHARGLTCSSDMILIEFGQSVEVPESMLSPGPVK